MRLPRFKFSVRTLMIAVAVGAILLWAGMVGSRSVVYLNRATVHEQVGRGIQAQAMNLRHYADRHREKGEAVPDSMIKLIRDHEANAQSHEALARTYREAAYRPWRSIAIGRDVDGP